MYCVYQSWYSVQKIFPKSLISICVFFTSEVKLHFFIKLIKKSLLRKGISPKVKSSSCIVNVSLFYFAFSSPAKKTLSLLLFDRISCTWTWNALSLWSVCILFVVSLFASLKGRKVGQSPLTTRVQTHIVRYATASEQIMVEYSEVLKTAHNYV